MLKNYGKLSSGECKFPQAADMDKKIEVSRYINADVEL